MKKYSLEKNSQISSESQRIYVFRSYRVECFQSLRFISLYSEMLQNEIVSVFCDENTHLAIIDSCTVILLDGDVTRHNTEKGAECADQDGENVGGRISENRRTRRSNQIVTLISMISTLCVH